LFSIVVKKYWPKWLQEQAFVCLILNGVLINLALRQ
jgi:hypothetical protein